MSKLDLERFLKVAGMMASEHDGEALAALRRANKMLADAQLTWGELLSGHAPAGHHGARPTPAQTAAWAGQPRTNPFNSAAWNTSRDHTTNPFTKPRTYEQAASGTWGARVTPDQKWQVWRAKYPQEGAWIDRHKLTNSFAAACYAGVRKYGHPTDKMMNALRRIVEVEAAP